MFSNEGRPEMTRSWAVRAVATLAAVAVTGAAVSACGSSSSGASSSSGSSTSGAAVATTSSSSATPAAAGVTGGTLSISFDPPLSLNPALGGTSESDIVYAALAYDSLVYQTGAGKFIPDLATKWAYVPGSKNRVFDLTLRSGVHFSDGSLMTPASVANSLRYFQKAGGQEAQYIATLVSAKPRGAHGLRLTFAKPAPDLPYLLSQYQDVGQIIGPQGIANPKKLDTTSDGTGPYVLSATQSVANSKYVFTRNPHYWNPSAVHYHEVDVKVITDPQTALSAVQSGQLSAATQLPATLLSTAKSAGLQTYAEPYSIASLFLLDRKGTISPLGKLAVRQALNLAVNRPQLSSALSAGTGTPTDEVALPGTTGYDPALAQKYPYDVAKAKQLLVSAGYPHGFKLAVLDTLALDPSGDIAAALKSQLAAIGVQLQITETPAPPQFVPEELSKKYAAIIWPFSANGYGFPYRGRLRDGALQQRLHVVGSDADQADGHRRGGARCEVQRRLRQGQRLADQPGVVRPALRAGQPARRVQGHRRRAGVLAAELDRGPRLTRARAELGPGGQLSASSCSRTCCAGCCCRSFCCSSSPS